MGDEQTIESVKNQISTIKASVDFLIDFKNRCNVWQPVIAKSVDSERLQDIGGPIRSLINTTNTFQDTLQLISTNLDDLNQKLSH